MIEKVKLIFKKDRNVLILICGTLLSVIIPFLANFILTQLYSEKEFGMFQVYFNYSMILSVIITLRYEMAIILPKKKEDAKHVFILAVCFSGLISTVLLIVVLLFRFDFSKWMKEPNLANIFLLLPFTVFVIGVYQSYNYWCNRQQQYTTLAISKVVRSFNMSLASVVLWIVPFFKKTGLVFGDFLGQLLAVVFLQRRIRRKGDRLFSEISKPKLKEMFLRYKQFPMYNVPSGLLEKMANNLPNIIMTGFFGIGTIGYISLSQRLIGTPGSIVARSFGDVFRQQAQEKYAQDFNCELLFKATLKKLFLLSVIPFTLLFFFIKPLAVLLLGADWAKAGEYAQILIPMYFLQFMVSPLSSMFLVAEQQRRELFIQLALLLGVLVAIYGSFYFYGTIQETLYYFCLVFCLKYVVEFWLSYQFSKGNFRKI